MLKHIVLFKLTLDTDPDFVLNECRQEIDNLRSIDGIESAVMTKNILDRKGNYDLMLTINIGNMDQLKAYIDDPIHKALANKIKSFVTDKVKFDYI